MYSLYNSNKMKSSTIIILVIGVSLLISLGIYQGFHSKDIGHFSIYKSGESFVRANYSEQDCGLDFDGDYSCSTDYWDEVVSDQWYFESINHKVTVLKTPKENFNEPFVQFKGFPRISRPHDKRNFDRYSKHANYTYKLYILGDWYSINSNEYNFCLGRLDKKAIKVNFWYNMVTSVEKL